MNKPTKSPIQPQQLDGYVKIINDGLIDVNAFTLLGATSKRGDENMIGFFGSGLKYAIAVLMKFDIPFRVFSGEKEIKITAVTEKFRGQEFKVIKVNGRKTSLTTDMGPDWEAWYAIREIYCNALDEGNANIGITDEVKPEKGKTTFFVKFDYQLAELFSNWNKYFSEKRNDIVANSPEHQTKVFAGNPQQLIVYRRGVRCYQQKQKSLFHYDLGWIEINESRVVASTWDLSFHLPKVLGKMATQEMVREIFDNYKDSFEGTLNWDMVSMFNENWLDVLDGRTIIIDSVAGYFLEEIANNEEKHIQLPADLAEALKGYFGNRVHIKGRSDEHGDGYELNMSQIQAQDCQFAIDFFKKAGIHITAPIVVYKFNDDSRLGEAKDGKIRLSEKVFDLGRRQVLLTILEEHAHLESGHGDKTRAFQDFLFNTLLSSFEEKTGVRL